MYLCGGECCVVEGDRLVICPVQWNEVIPSEWTALQASRRLRFRRPCTLRYCSRIMPPCHPRPHTLSSEDKQDDRHLAARTA
jgi:hypothetical protein